MSEWPFGWSKAGSVLRGIVWTPDNELILESAGDWGYVWCVTGCSRYPRTMETHRLAQFREAPSDEDVRRVLERGRREAADEVHNLPVGKPRPATPTRYVDWRRGARGAGTDGRRLFLMTELLLIALLCS